MISNAWKWVIQHRFIVTYSCGAAIFLIALNQWLWPTPDEYFYTTIAHALTASMQGIVNLADINTEHVALLSAIGAVYQAVVQPSTLSEGRFFMIIFGLGIIWLLYAMAAKVIPEPSHRSWLLWLLLLIPGFWVFSVRFMLDIPATFAVGLIVYLLLSKKPALYVSLGLVLLLLFKEYFVYLLVPTCMAVYAIDAVHSKDFWWQASARWLLRCITICIPLYLVTILLIDFTWLPYPRLLENGLAFIFKDYYFWLNQHTILLFNGFVHLFDPTISFVSPAFSVASENAPTIITPSSIDEVVKILPNTTVNFTQSPANISQTDFLGKLWNIYQYNFLESDISIFILPLSALGILVRCQTIWRTWKQQYPAIRPDIIFALLLGVFAYFNYHEANSLIGFRVTLPIMFPLLYFAYHGASTLLDRPRRWQTAVFIGTMSMAIMGYWFTVKDLVYGSVIANHSILSGLVYYKPYLFIAMFVLLMIGMLIYPMLRWSKKSWLIPILLFGLFTVKFAPFYFEAQASEKLYGYEYGLPNITPILEPLMNGSVQLCSNINFYKQQYYAGDVRIGNEGISPYVRTFNQYYPNYYHTCPFTDDFLANLQTEQIQYVLVVNDDYDGSDYQHWLSIYQQNMELFTLVNSQQLHGRVQWELYQVNE